MKQHKLQDRQIPQPDEMAGYKELKMSDGTLVGYTCLGCGWVYENRHSTECRSALAAMNSKDSIVKGVLFLLSVCGDESGVAREIIAEIRAEYLGEKPEHS